MEGQVPANRVRELVVQARSAGFRAGVSQVAQATGQRDTIMGREMCGLGSMMREAANEFAAQALLAEGDPMGLRVLIDDLLGRYLIAAEGVQRVGLALCRTEKLGTA
jgi:hypothetical protein